MIRVGQTDTGTVVVSMKLSVCVTESVTVVVSMKLSVCVTESVTVYCETANVVTTDVIVEAEIVVVPPAEVTVLADWVVTIVIVDAGTVVTDPEMVWVTEMVST